MRYPDPVPVQRAGLAVLLSVLAHGGVGALALGLGIEGFSGPVDVELTDVRIEEVKELPLGGTRPGEAEANRAKARARSRSAEAPATGTLRTPDEEAAPKPGAADGEEASGPAPTSDLGAYGPEGSRFTVLIRLDRLRGTDYRGPVDELLMRLPDRRDLLEGTGLDLFDDFDALLAATPNPLDPTVTFVAARHRLDEGGLKSALNRAARGRDYSLAWRTEGGRPIAERRARRGAAGPSRDDRLFVLAGPGLAVVTPRAYRSLLLGRAPAADEPPSSPPADGADGGAANGDGGELGRSSAASMSWAGLLSRIDAEEGLMPSDGAVMINAVDIFKAAGSSSSAESPIFYGMEVPPAVNAVIGVSDSPFLDLVATFKREGPARHWETEWPNIQRKLRTNPLVVLSGFSPLVARAKVTREGQAVRLHLPVTRDETLRLLTFAATRLASRHGELPLR